MKVKDASDGFGVGKGFEAKGYVEWCVMGHRVHAGGVS